MPHHNYDSILYQQTTYRSLQVERNKNMGVINMHARGKWMLKLGTTNWWAFWLLVFVWRLTTAKFCFHPFGLFMEFIAGCKNKKGINYLMFEQARIQDLRIGTSYTYQYEYEFILWLSSTLNFNLYIGSIIHLWLYGSMGYYIYFFTVATHGHLYIKNLRCGTSNHTTLHYP